MDSRDLQILLPFVSASGHNVSQKEKAAMQSSLLLLRSNHKFTSVLFWGKIFGVKNDYLVAQGVYGNCAANADDGEAKWFYSFDGAEWFDLDPLTDADRQYASKVRGILTGKPDQIYRLERILTAEEIAQREAKAKAAAEREDDDEEEEEEEEETPKKYELLEQTRLAYIIEQINGDARIVPRGAYLLNASQSIVPNRTFEGLDANTDALSLASYQHLREPVSMKAKSLLEKEHLNKAFDCLDTLADDVPVDQWRLHYDPVQQLVSIQSLKWRGSYFFHRAGCREFGSVYFGNGVCNFDLGFML